MTREATVQILELVDEGVLDARAVLQMALNYMSEADVADMASSEGLDESFWVPEEEEEEDEDDGQPSWEQEWEDFGETYSDEYNVL